ncbi:nickel pincer cofactor biosynthesis protein LarC [Planococcus shenhongbingii]|uniref:Pyridinium-3,5-bisthiocarboxylic acid mononucleotide nickel insertion protein n=1 Tax=Planococcus shenhongbingii TaxID=3058398 RepID=A0ABT8NCC4_9BACL|nr:nickel pincer cofactor biosynthesis protein LarC [Planococcus sp. N017]MDN7245210.1 nickel pincer cofactor biosynthesis protein LarC [Planococcus sp. N017]
MKLLYLDCQSGISGDMTLSALIDLGADIHYISEHLEKLPIDPFTLNVKQVDKRGISAKLLDLQFQEAEHSHTHSHDDNHSSGHSHEHSHSHSHSHNHEHEHLHDHHHSHGHSHSGHEHAHDDGHHSHSHRKASTILGMIGNSELPPRVKQRSLAVFRVIAEAEGKIHGMDSEEVHFHEVGAMDSIIDIIGVCLALESLGVDRIAASPVPTGHGKIMIAHGLYPIPAPATAEILKGVPLADFHVRGELTTPTGAAFLKALADDYGQLPGLAIDNIGYGAGKKNFEHPNVLRALMFNEETATAREKISVLECQLDDSTGETLGYVMERLLGAGALDVYYTPVAMKKSRPGTLITVLAKPENAFVLEDILLRETSTFGVRKTDWTRRILDREFKIVATAFGSITVKVGRIEGEIIKMSPEFEEVKKAAAAHKVPLRDVFLAVQQAAGTHVETLDNVRY